MSHQCEGLRVVARELEATDFRLLELAHEVERISTHLHALTDTVHRLRDALAKPEEENDADRT